MENMYPKVGLEEEIKRGGKEGKRVNDYEVYHIC
jgi:hypothetical protein